MSTVKKSGNFVPPGTPGEEAAAHAGDGAGEEDAAERARVKRQRVAEHRVIELKTEIEQIKYGPGDPENKRRVIAELLVEIAALERAILDAKGGEVRKADALDLLLRGRATAFEQRGGTSVTVDVVAALPSEISKDERDFWADVASESLGVKRPKDSIRKGDVEIPLSNPFGLRYYDRRKP